MATLINRRLRFLHVPKTGGTWATEAMFAAGVIADRPPSVPFHGGLADTSGFGDRFTFAFIRHPLEFWLSYWGFRMRTGWDLENGIDSTAASADFGEFIDALVRHHPGAASAVYEQSVGRAGEEIDFVGRHERLADDLCVALGLAGEVFDEQRLRSHPPANRADLVRYPACYTRETAERLAAAESAAIERFYAHDPIPRRLLGQPEEPARPGALHLQRSAIELRDARAELAALRRADLALQSTLETQRRELADAREALSLLRSSRVLRWSRPLRLTWYSWRANPSLRGRVSWSAWRRERRRELHRASKPPVSALGAGAPAPISARRSRRPPRVPV